MQCPMQARLPACLASRRSEVVEPWQTPATIETLVGASGAIGHRRLTSGFAFGPRWKIGVSRDLLSLWPGCPRPGWPKLFVDEGAHVFISGRRKDALDE